MQRTFLKDLAASGLAATGAPGPAVAEADLAPLPAAVQRYLRFMGVVGRPRDETFRLHFRGRFRLGGRWLACEGWQLDSRPDLARIFHMQLRLWGVPVYGRDLYLRGHGAMIIRPLDLFTLQHARGPEFDVGELVTLLNDLVLLAPTMLLGPGVTFAAVDDRSFDVALEDGGRRVRARVFLDGRGAPVDFETTDRFVEDPHARGHPLVRARWSTPIDGWQVVDGRALPTAGRAVWKLPQGDYPYVEFAFDPGELAFNVAPGGAPVTPSP